MRTVLTALLRNVAAAVRSRTALYLEILVLSPQLAVLHHRGPKRLHLRPVDSFFRARLSKPWPDWRNQLIIVKPETVGIRRHCAAISRDELKDLEISTRSPAGSDRVGHHSPAAAAAAHRLPYPPVCRVEFSAMRAHAVFVHDEPRGTWGVDIWVEPAPE